VPACCACCACLLCLLCLLALLARCACLLCMLCVLCLLCLLCLLCCACCAVLAVLCLPAVLACCACLLCLLAVLACCDGLFACCACLLCLLALLVCFPCFLDTILLIWDALGLHFGCLLGRGHAFRSPFGSWGWPWTSCRRPSVMPRARPGSRTGPGTPGWAELHSRPGGSTVLLGSRDPGSGQS
jgi:hypothetical protein